MRTRATAAGAATLATTALLVVGAGSLGLPPQAAPAWTTRTTTASSYAEGAPPGFSGGFNGQSCDACHFHAELNTEPGRVTIAGVPARFVAGERYPLTITLSRPGIKLGGFQLTTRFEDGGGQAGTLAPAPGEEERVGIDIQGDVEYANQRRKGAALPGHDLARWMLVWTAPTLTGPVVFHVAANAADGDETAEGDYVHTAAVVSVP